MAYWVYENTIHKKTRVHTEACSFCDAGHGLHKRGDTPTGSWHGPFDEVAIALEAAHRTGQPDARGCRICLGAITNSQPAFQTSTGVADGKTSALADWEQNSEVRCLLVMHWSPKGRVNLENDRPRFPRVEASAGLYRLTARYPDGRLAAYVGESDNLRRRFGNYRNPGPTQQTSQRINVWLKELLSTGGEVSVSTGEGARLDGKDADLSKRAVRRMLEHMSIVLGSANKIESLNR
jgi:hypothetical protein